MYMVTVEETFPDVTQGERDGEKVQARNGEATVRPKQECNFLQTADLKDEELVDVNAEESGGEFSTAPPPQSDCGLTPTDNEGSQHRDKAPPAAVDDDLEVTVDVEIKAAHVESETDDTDLGGDAAGDERSKLPLAWSDVQADSDHREFYANVPSTGQEQGNSVWDVGEPPAEAVCSQEVGKPSEGDPREPEHKKTEICSAESSFVTDRSTTTEQQNFNRGVQERSSLQEEESDSPVWVLNECEVQRNDLRAAECQEETAYDSTPTRQEEACLPAACESEEKGVGAQNSVEEKPKELLVQKGDQLEYSESSSHGGAEQSSSSAADSSENSETDGSDRNGTTHAELNHSSPKSSEKQPEEPNSQTESGRKASQERCAYTEYVTMPSISKQALDRQASGWSVQSDLYEGTEHELLVLLRQGRSDLKYLKKFLRKHHWPTDHGIRHNMWTTLCRYLHKAEGDLYEEMEKELFSPEDLEEGAELALPCFVDHGCLTNYHLSDRGIAQTTRIVAIINHMNPDITYSPVTYALSCLFMHYMGTSDCFNCISALLKSKEQRFLTQTKVAMEVSKLVVRDLAKKHVKSAYVFLVRQTSNVDSVFENWIWWIFKDLPFSHVVRVIDCFLCEGIKVLYRVALAILKLFAKHSGKKSREPDSVVVANNISRFCERMPVDVSKLLKEAFRIRNFTRAEISRLEMKHEVYVKSRAVLGNGQDMPRVLSVQSISGVSLSKTFSGPNFMAHARSSILSPDMTHAVWGWLPVRFGVCQPYLLFTTEEHGTSLRTLYSRVEHAPQTLIIIKATTGEVFGAFCSSAWIERTSHGQNLSYFGTGETFIFSLRPEKLKYEWVGLLGSNIPNTASMFLAGDNSVMTIGGGKGEAIKLDENMNHCRSERCDTFMNDPLSADRDFTCQVVEVFGFK